MKKYLSNTGLYKVAAKNLGLKVEQVHKKQRPKWEVLMISHGRKFFLVSGAKPGLFPEARKWNGYFSDSKMLSQKVLSKIGYNTIPSKDILVSDYSSERVLTKHLASKKYTYPSLIKRDKGQNANNIAIVENIKQLQQVARKHYLTKSSFMIQPILDQDEYRVLVVNKKVVLMHSKENRFVVGDGTSTISQLLDAIPNIKKDSVFEQWQHSRQGTKPTTVLSKGKHFDFHLTKIPSTTFYRTKNIPAEVRKWALQLADDMSTAVVGIDVFIPDLHDSKSYTIIEINNNPGVHYLEKDCNDLESSIKIYEMVIKNFFKLK